ncbi:MAG: sulfatase [Candidatus Hydrogenedentota bacterium]
MKNAMNRRTFLKMAAVSAGLLRAGGGGAAPRVPPNVLLFVIDDLGWRDFGCYGNRWIDTPNFDRFAAESIRFTNAYANAPVCSPSRAALMTGQYPARLRFTGHITAIGRHRHPDDSRIIPPDDRMFLRHVEISLAEMVEPVGYATAHIGKWHLGGEGYWPKDQGFDVNVGGWTHGSPPGYWYPYENPDKEWNSSIPTLEGGEPGEYLTDRLADEAIAFIEAHREGPFFVHLSHYAVHTPLEAPGDLVAKYRERLSAAEDASIDPVYAAMVERVDRNFGHVMDSVERLGLKDNTAVIVFSDNGGLLSATDNRPLRLGKGSLYEGGIRVPLMVRWPGHIEPGSVCHEPVMGADLYPTIAGIVGEKAAPGSVIDGVDLAPLLAGKESLDRDALYWYYPHYSPQEKQPAAAIRKGDYKLIEFYDPPDIELYNLEEDLSETQNLAPEMPEKAKELLEQLHQWLDSVDPKLHTLNPEHQKE